MVASDNRLLSDTSRRDVETDRRSSLLLLVTMSLTSGLQDQHQVTNTSKRGWQKESAQKKNENET